jgi:septum site-determining protein MinC
LTYFTFRCYKLLKATKNLKLLVSGGESKVVTNIIDEDSLSNSDFLYKQVASTVTGDEKVKIITARGTEDGLVLRIDGRAEWGDILSGLDEFLIERKSFLTGGEVSIEWLDRLPTKEQSQGLEQKLRDEYGIGIVGRRKRPEQALALKETASKASKQDSISSKRTGVTIPLFENLSDNSQWVAKHDGNIEGKREKTSFGEYIAQDVMAGSEGISSGLTSGQLSRMAEILGDNVFYDEEANAKVVFGTLRSGQRIETPFSLLVVGDVNPGADLVAGGDIIIFGSLRGTAHASAYNDEALDRVIVALQMQPMQLRIGSVISRGSGESVSGAEIARIEDRRIIVEEFNTKFSFKGKRND